MQLILLPLITLAAAPKPDLAVTITPPASHVVETQARYDITVANNGNGDATSTSLVIRPPLTHTSPQVSILGVLGARSAGCTQSGNTLVCALGTVRKHTSRAVWFEIALPYSAAPLVIQAQASANQADANPANNLDDVTASLTYRSIALGGADRAVRNRHCTGTGLTSFFECELYPSSISFHDTILEAGGTIGFVGVPPGVYTGAWSQPFGTTSLELDYFENGDLVAHFDGFGATSTCFEGLTTFFPPSPYVAPYEVCLQ